MINNNEIASWLRLTLVPGVGPERQRALLAHFGLPEIIFSSPHKELARVIGDRQASDLLSTDNRSQVDTALSWLEQDGNTILTLADPSYPVSLLQTADPPILLYLKGHVELLKNTAIAIIGARNATPRGMADAEAFAAEFSAVPLCVVSGLATGIDTAAHVGALKASGSTIAVIGTGADRIYPSKNINLARQISEQGLIVSEFPLGTPAAAYNFPRRNRIISGLSQGVLVVEAAQNSGSLITARLAAEQGREVFAIPGSIHSPLSKGCHQLIKQGGKLVEEVRDVLEELRLQSHAQNHDGEVTDEIKVSSVHADVLAKMSFDPVDFDSLIGYTRLTADALFAILTELELDGRVARLAGGRFQRQH